MEVLVTGATGFIGLAVCEDMLAAGHRVHMLGSSAPPDTWTQRMSRVGGWSFEACDVRAADAIAAIIARVQPDVLIHGAAVTPAGGASSAVLKSTLEINTLGTLNVASSAVAAGVPRFILLSSASVYGAASFTDAQLDEVKTIPEPETAYAVSKYAAEKLCQLIGSERKITMKIVRLGSVFGPWEHASGVRATLSPIYQVSMAALDGQAATLPRSCRRDWTYSRDIARAVRLLASSSAATSPILNVGLGQEWQLEAWCGKLAERFSGFDWRISGAAASSINLHSTVDRAPLATTRIFDELGFVPIFGIDAAFEDYIAWLQPGAGASAEQVGP